MSEEKDYDLKLKEYMLENMDNIIRYMLLTVDMLDAVAQNVDVDKFYTGAFMAFGMTIQSIKDNMTAMYDYLSGAPAEIKDPYETLGIDLSQGVV